MNWKEIEKKYQKAFEKVNSFVFHDYFYDEEHGLPLQDRFLYDFFDKQGIRCFVLYNEMNGKWKPELRIVVRDKWPMERIGIINCENTRLEAEERVFLRAFEILEEKLKNSG